MAIVLPNKSVTATPPPKVYSVHVSLKVKPHKNMTKEHGVVIKIMNVIKSRSTHCCSLHLPAVFHRLRLAATFTSISPHRHLTNRISISNSSVRSSAESDVYKSNVKFTTLGRHGNVQEARKLFDEMPHRDCVSYASMITIYIKNNDLSTAEKLFRAIPFRNIVAESAMVDAYVKAGLMDEARRVFDNMTDRNVYSWTSLISGYFKNGQIDEARRLFDRMPAKNVVSWTTVVLGYARNGLIDQARNTFDNMPEKNIVAWTSMIKSYVENDQIDEGFKLFYSMPQRNLYSWNIMISSCLANQRINEAIQLFNSMPQRNVVTWTTMVTGLAQNGLIKQARDYFDLMPNKDIAAWNAMITSYADEGLMVEARELFDSMPESNIVTWNAIIDGFARNGPNGEALSHLIFMLRSCIVPNVATITSVLTSCGGILELMQAHTLVILLGFEQDTSLTNTLITMYSRTGDLSSAVLTFQNHGSLDVVSWTAMILAYSTHGYGVHALHVFARMLKAGTKPDGITFVGILTACSHAGLVKKGERIFESMSRVYCLEPKAEHYSCLVDMLGRAGRVEEAMRVVCEMPPGERDGAVLGAMLGACRLHGDVEVAYYVGEKLIELEPTSSGGYVLLGNVYAACGKWDEFAQLRKKMKERNVKKVPGASQIEINGKSHLFLVGDRSHPEVEEIYGLLQERLLPLMQDIGVSKECAKKDMIKPYEE